MDKWEKMNGNRGAMNIHRDDLWRISWGFNTFYENISCGKCPPYISWFCKIPEQKCVKTQGFAASERKRQGNTAKHGKQPVLCCWKKNADADSKKTCDTLIIVGALNNMILFRAWSCLILAQWSWPGGLHQKITWHSCERLEKNAMDINQLKI